MAKEASIKEPQHVRAGKSLGHIDCHHKNGQPCAEPDPLVLHISAHDEAKWSSSEGRWFEIDFKSRSPFAESNFELKVGESVGSGPITGNPGTYKYSLVNDLGKVTDPTIIIQE